MKFLFISVFCLFLAGCGISTPQDVTNDFISAVQKSETEDAFKLIAKSSAEKIEKYILKVNISKAEYIKAITDQFLRIKLITDEAESKDNVASVTVNLFQGGDNVGEIQVVLIREAEGSKWYISEFAPFIK